MERVVTFGEVMLRLAPPGYLRLLQATTLEMTFGGAEVNVAVALAQLGLNAAFITRLPKNDVAQRFINEIRGYGVDTSQILRGGERIGVYFVEKGASQRASTVLYDRAHSAIAEINPAELDWETILEGAKAFHFTGITPALSENCATAVLEACQKAKAKGITVSCDLNYRKKLWDRKKAEQVMGELLPLVDVCIANEEDAETVFGIKAEGSDLTGGVIDHARYEEVAKKLVARFPNLTGVAITLRESFSASRNGWSGMYYTEGTPYFSRRYEIDIVDRVGGGDSFAAGLLYGLLTGKNAQDTVEFAVAASCLKHSIQGDFNMVSLGEVEALVGGDASGRVRR
jgi:2-dehydro-3-deoxygluconokinase